MKKIGHLIALTAADFGKNAEEVRAQVADLCRRFPLYAEL